MAYVKSLTAAAGNKTVIDSLNAGADKNPVYSTALKLQNPRIERILANAGVTTFDASGKIAVADLDAALKTLAHPMSPVDRMTLKASLRSLGCLK